MSEERKEETDFKLLDQIKKVMNTITEEIVIELDAGGRPKVPKRKIGIWVNEIQYLRKSIENGLIKNTVTKRPEHFSFGGMQERNIAVLFFSLGVLIGIYEGLPGKKNVLKIFKEFYTDLLEKL